MPRYQFVPDSGVEWGPLERIAALAAKDQRLPTIDPADFMYMGRVVAPRRADIHLYKHIHTRRYLNTDDAGHTYWFTGGVDGTGDDALDAGEYVPAGDLAASIQHLDVHHLGAHDFRGAS